MQPTHVPQAGDRYWVGLSMASVFGANSGDFIAKYFHLGHAGGLLPLAVLLAVIFVAERRDRSVHQAYYWLAIVVVRTVATNLADFGASDLRLGRVWLIAALALLLALLLVFAPPAKSAATAGRWPLRLPTTDARYWVAMLTAGTLGTVIGDLASFTLGLGTGGASLVQGGLLALLFVIGRRGPFEIVWFYWLAVVTVRAAGTSFSDFLAHNVFGLPLSTLVTGLVFIITMLLWRVRPPYQLKSSEAA